MFLLDRSSYLKFLDGVIPSIFATPEWLDIVCPKSWKVLAFKDKDGEINAAIPFHAGRHWSGITWLRMPILTPYLAPAIMISESDRTLETTRQVIQIASSFHYVNLLLDPSIIEFETTQENLYTRLEKTFRLSHIKQHDHLFSHFKSSCRNKIRKAQNIVTIGPTDLHVLNRLADKTFFKHGRPNPYPPRILEKIIKLDTCRMWAAIDADGSPHAAHLVVWDNQCAYNLITVSDPDLHQSGAVSLLLWHSIQYVSDFVDVYDFEGGMIPNIAKFYQSFGAMQQSYFRLYGSKSSYWQRFFHSIGKLTFRG
ncbi:MAG: GNAT family N-acetyltransferase [Saprospiraceae bacterium]|nr:GNAT family N-acetyltransferase [Saprospiraceae bacterium]